MKKYLIGLFAIIAIATCAFTLKPSSQVAKKENSEKQVSLYWFIPERRQSIPAGKIPRQMKLVLAAAPINGTVHCEDGYDDDDLNTSGNPYSGLKLGADINEWIRKS
jgi:hypothetical protein